jgi:adenine-specific DNA-methyltransferase
MTQQPTYGPHNPHPLSQMRTELVWEGKYDEYGQRREVDIASCAMPMQKIEEIDEPRREAAATQQLTLFEQQNTRVDDFRNRLVWGDNKLVMASLLQEFKGKVDLIYIDPPFDVGADFSMRIPIGDEKETLSKDQSVLEMVAYRDIWGKGSDSYLQMIHERLALIKGLLSDNGSILVHLDDSVASHVKIILDELFDTDNFRSQVVWQRVTSHSDRKGFAFNYDVIFHYTKSQNFVWNPQYQAYDESYLKSHYRSVDKDGRRYELADISAAGAGEPRIFFGKLIAPPPGTHWRWSQERIDKLIAENRIELTKNGTPRYKRYLDEMPGKAVQATWTDIPPVNSQAHQDTGYDTQKPEGLLERIILALSNEGDLVADFFCGSGTTGAVADRLGRRWIMADLGRFAIHTSRKRLIELQHTLHKDGKPYRAFDVYNLGRYERQWWQQERLQGADTEHRRVILEFFRAEVLTNTTSPLLHGRKAGAFCHVDGIDSMFTREEAKAVAQATAAAGGRECYCLAWEFEMDLHLLVNALATELGVKLKLIQIPREIMEKNRKAPPPFLEVAVLAAEAVYRKSPHPLTPSPKSIH